MAAVGPGVSGPWEPEQRVMALLCGGGYAEYVAVPEGLLLPVPPALTLCQAAAVPEAWLTAFQLLHLVGNGYATMLTHPLGRRGRHTHKPCTRTRKRAHTHTRMNHAHPHAHMPSTRSDCKQSSSIKVSDQSSPN